MWFVLYHLKSNHKIQVNGKSNNKPNVWLWSAIFPQKWQKKSRVLYYLLLSLAQQHTATHMLIACPKTAPIRWIDLGVGRKLKKKSKNRHSTSHITTATVTILPSNILLEKLLGQWLVLSSFTNWLWKNIGDSSFYCNQWGFGTQILSPTLFES